MSGGERIDDTPVHKALREALANCLIHADYHGLRSIVIRKEADKLILANPGYIRTGKKRMTYKKDGEAAYHVDLVVYTYADKDDTDSQLYLARGKNSESDETCWEKSDPVGLVNDVNDKYKGDDAKEDREQFRRIIRYFKRWKNKKFSNSGNAEPPGIGITLIAVDKFEVSKKYDYLEEKYIYDDLDAVLNFAKEIKDLFKFN